MRKKQERKRFGAGWKLLAATFLFSMLLSVQSVMAATIVLDPGHGGPGTAGAGCIYPPYMEKILTLDLANKLKAELAGVPGLTVHMTRTSDVEMGLDQRAAYAKSVGADFLISIHFNSSAPHDKTGTEIWTSAFGENFVKGYHLGQQVLSQYTAMGLESKGVKTKLGTEGDYYGIIRHGVANGIPTIIIEHCFLDNPYDRSVYEKNGNAGFAHADAVAIINYARNTWGIDGAAQAAKTQNAAAAAQPAAATAAGSTPAAAPAAAVSKTKYGFLVDGIGSVHYQDASGGKEIFSASEWKKLLANWSYTSDPEFFLKSVSAAELRAVLGK